jgi:drug/metabolite transporter (DMT)-like permease
VSTRGSLLFVSLCVIWGVPYLLIRVAVRELTPAVLVCARTGGAALLLVPVAAARAEIRPALRRAVPLVAFALVEIAIPWLLLSSAERRITSSLSGLLVAAVPLVGALIAWRTRSGERLGRTSVAGLVLGVAGVGALVGLDLGGLDATALLKMTAVVIGYAVGPAILSRYLADVPPVGVISMSLALTALIYLPIAAFSLPARLPSAKVLAATAVLIVVCTAIAFLVFFALIAEVGPVRATVITYVNPAVAVALGVGLLGERFTVGMGVGFVLILTGSILATRARRPIGIAATEPAR